MNKEEYYDWIERKRLMSRIPDPKDTGMEHANYMIKRTMEMFNMVQKVVVRSDEELRQSLASKFKPDEEGCLEWTKGQKFREQYAKLSPRSKESFLRIGKVAKEYFGEELVRKCWKHKEPEQIKVALPDQIKQARAIESMSRDTFLEQLKQAKAIEGGR